MAGVKQEMKDMEDHNQEKETFSKLKQSKDFTLNLCTFPTSGEKEDGMETLN